MGVAGRQDERKEGRLCQKGMERGRGVTLHGACIINNSEHDGVFIKGSYVTWEILNKYQKTWDTRQEQISD